MKLELVSSLFALLLSVFFGAGTAPVPNQVFSNANHVNNEYPQSQVAENLVWDRLKRTNKPEPLINTQSFWLGCLCDTDPLLQKAPDAQVPLASVTKIMTAYLALREIGPDYLVTITHEAVATEGIAGDLQAGEQFSLKDLITMAMTYSSNDAAMALAEALGRAHGARTFFDAIAQTVWLMNEEARLLGMTSTFFQNPTGLDLSQKESSDPIAPSNFSSAQDTTKLLEATLSLPLLWDLSRNPAPSVRSMSGISHSLINLNPFRVFPHYIGGKTGTTDFAGENLVMLFERPLGEPHALILFGAPSGQREAEAQKLLDWIASF